MNDQQESFAGVQRSSIRTLVFDHPYWSLFVLALVVRAGAALAINHAFDGSLFLDDRTYVDMATDWAEGSTERWDSYTAWLFTRTATLLVPLGLVFKLVGGSMLVGQLFVAFFGAITAVLVARLVAMVLELRWALLAGGVVAVWPSLVIFSATVMKDALAWAALVGLAVAIGSLNRSTGPRMYASAALAAGLLLALGHIRVHTLVVAAWALLIAVVVGPAAGKPARIGVAFLLVLVIPWMVTAGPFGVQMGGAIAEIEAIRTSHATGGSAVEASGTARGLAYLPTGITVMLFEPLPWRSAGTDFFNLARIENVGWYVLLMLAAAGAWRGVWAHRDVLPFPLIVGGGTLLMWSFVEGNIGTAFRHRGEFAWAVVVFAVMGASTLMREVGTRSSDDGGEEHPVRLRGVSGGSGRAR